MKKINFNGGWKYRHLNTDNEWKCVTLPHDAAIYEERSNTAEAGVNTGWYLGADYEYVKTFSVPDGYKDKNVIFEFEQPLVFGRGHLPPRKYVRRRQKTHNVERG